MILRCSLLSFRVCTDSTSSTLKIIVAAAGSSSPFFQNREAILPAVHAAGSSHHYTTQGLTDPGKVRDQPKILATRAPDYFQIPEAQRIIAEEEAASRTWKRGKGREHEAVKLDRETQKLAAPNVSGPQNAGSDTFEHS